MMTLEIFVQYESLVSGIDYPSGGGGGGGRKDTTVIRFS